MAARFLSPRFGILWRGDRRDDCVGACSRAGAEPEAGAATTAEEAAGSPAKLPNVGADRTRGLDFLFGALKAAPDEASAKHVEARIWALWLQTPSDTAALLMARAKAAMDAKQMDVALKLLDAVSSYGPNMSKRGTGVRLCTTCRTTILIRWKISSRCSRASRAISARWRVWA